LVPRSTTCAALLAKETLKQLCVECLFTKESWNPEVASIFDAAARYRRATVGSFHDDAHPDNSTLHMGKI
jgi:hypothetical protein